TTLHSPREMTKMFAAVTLPYFNTATPNKTDCNPMNTQPASSHGHAARGTARSCAWKNGTKPKPSTGTNAIIAGRKRPGPHGGDHFCRSTSNSAKIADDVPAIRIAPPM